MAVVLFFSDLVLLNLGEYPLLEELFLRLDFTLLIWIPLVGGIHVPHRCLPWIICRSLYVAQWPHLSIELSYEGSNLVWQFLRLNIIWFWNYINRWWESACLLKIRFYISDLIWVVSVFKYGGSRPLATIDLDDSQLLLVTTIVEGLFNFSGWRFQRLELFKWYLFHAGSLTFNL